MTEDSAAQETTSYWPSAADLFMTLFLIMVAVLAAAMYALLPKHRNYSEKPIIEAVGLDLRHVRDPVNRLRVPLDMPAVSPNSPPDKVVASLNETCDAAIKRLSDLEEKVKILQDRINENEKLFKEFGTEDAKTILAKIDDLTRQLNDKPPIIRIDEQREEYRFKSGSAEIGEQFSEGLSHSEFQRLANEIVERSKPGRAQVDTLEIIGHTDGIPLSGGGNLDERLPDLLGGKRQAMHSLRAGSNNDLGLLRALAVRHQWEDFIKGHPEREKLSALSVRCYSAGQTIPPDSSSGESSEKFVREDPRARRIEMRLTRLRDR